MAILQDLIVQGSTRLLNNAYVGYVHGGYMFGSISGNAETASRWQTPRTFTIGDQSLDVDGTGDVTFTISTMGLQPAITLVGSQDDNGYMVSLGNNQDVIIPKPTTTSTYGVIKTYQNATKTATQLSLGKTNTVGKYYGVVTTTDGFAYVNVPWTDTDIHVTGIRYSDNQDGILTTINQNDHHFDFTDTIPPMTNTTFGVAKTAFKDTDIVLEDLEPAAVTRNRWYGVQKLAKGGNLVVNIPWTDTMISSINGTGASPKVGYEMTFFSGTNSKTISVTPASNTSYGVLKSAAAPSQNIASLSVQTVALPGKYYGVVMTTDGFAYVNVNHPWKADGIYGASLNDCEASGQYSVAEGNNTSANGDASHSEGIWSEAWGDYSHAEGIYTVTMNEGEHAEGTYNVSHDGLTLHSIGIGTDDDERLNAIEVTNNGNMYLYGIGEYNGDSLDDAQSLQEYLDEFNETTAAALCDLSDRIDNINPDMPWVYGSGDGANNATQMKYGGSSATGQYSVAEGMETIASGVASHGEGYQNTASGIGAHVEGYRSLAQGEFSHAEGTLTTAMAYAHSEGRSTTGGGFASHAEGSHSYAHGAYSHAEGQRSTAYGYISHAGGFNTFAYGDFSITFGSNTLAYDFALAIGKQTLAYRYAIASGFQTTAYDYSTAEGYQSIAFSYFSHAEGAQTFALGSYSHAEGKYTKASGDYSHAEGSNTTASGDNSHAEGIDTDASGDTSHAEGSFTVALGGSSHAEGNHTGAQGVTSHAEGDSTSASGDASHAEGTSTLASGESSHAEGEFTQTTNRAEHAEGRFNKSNKASVDFGDAGNTIHSVGIGTGINARKNAFEIMQNGNTYLIGVGNYDGTNINGSTTYTLQKCVDLWEPGTGEHSIQQKYSGAKANGNYSIAIGKNNTIPLTYSFISGTSNSASFYNSNSTNLHIEGVSNTVNDGTSQKSANSHIEGGNNIIWGCDKSHIEGFHNVIYNEPQYTHIEGEQNIISAGRSSHIEGIGNSAGDQSGLAGSICIHVEGRDNHIIQGANYAKVSGIQNDVQSLCSNTEGFKNFNNGSYSHAEGFKTNTRANYSHTEGRGATFSNDSDLLIYLTADPETAYSAANIQGSGTIFYKKFTNNDASNKCKIHKTYDLEVGDVLTLKYYDTTEATNVPSTNYGAIAYNNVARIIDIEPFPGNSSFVYMTLETNSFTYTAFTRSGSTIPQSNWQSHFESIIPKAATITKPAIFCNGVTIGAYSHSEGNMTRAIGEFSHSEGSYTKAFNEAEHAQGAYNKSHWTNEAFGSANNTLFSIGCGTSSTDRKNAIEVMQNGDVYVNGVGNYDGTSIENVNTLQDVVNASGGSGGNVGNSKVFYGTCTTAAGTVAKVVDCDDFTSADLVEGVMVIVKFSATNTGAVANLTLNVNGTGAKGIKKVYNGAIGNLTAAAELYTGSVILFVYNGTYWVVAGLDSNTIGYQLRTNSMSLPMTSITYRYRLLFTSADGAHFVPANNSSSTNATASRTVCQDTIDPFGPIVYYGTTASVAAGSRPSATSLWRQYTISLGYSFNRTGAALTLTSWEPVYIKCAPQASGGAKIDATTPYVQTLPSTEDGMIYILLGVAYSDTAVELTMNHPVYYYSNGKIRIWTGVDTIESIPSSGYGQVKSIEVCQTPGDNPNTLYIVL